MHPNYAMHRKHLRTACPLFCFLLLASLARAQPPAVRWGKVSDREWRITRCEFDTSASALVLFDQGAVQFSFSSGVILRRHIRIKILSAKGMDEADVSLPFYAKDRLQSITDVDAQTINPDPAGKGTVQKVTSSQIFEVDHAENWREKKFGFPSVRVGSVLEYRYTIIKKSITFLEDWTFERHLPVAYSQFTASIPEDLEYRFLMTGNRLLEKYHQSTNTWSLENLPSLKPEPYVANPLDYANKVQFQLAGYNRRKDGVTGGIEYVNTMTSWEKLATECLEDDNYTRYLNRRGVARDLLAKAFPAGLSGDALSKARQVYQYVQSSVRWNGHHDWYTGSGPNELLEKREGGSGEINLLLTLLLREAGLTADPVLISTKEHGVVHRVYPFLLQFNHLLANVRIGEKDHLLDATDPFRPFDQLAEADLVEAGYLLSKDAPRWINVSAAPDSKQSVFIEADLSDPAQPKHKVNVRYSGYLALKQRKAYADQGKEAFVKSLQASQTPDLEVTGFTLANADSLDQLLVLNYTLTPEERTESTTDLIYLKPVSASGFTENPFRNEARFLPVEFDYPHSYHLTMSLKIPAGYGVQELPANLRLVTPDRSVEFDYLTSVTNQLVQIKTSVRHKATKIPSQHYPGLRELYTPIIAKYNEQIVLKKNR